MSTTTTATATATATANLKEAIYTIDNIRFGSLPVLKSLSEIEEVTFNSKLEVLSSAWINSYLTIQTNLDEQKKQLIKDKKRYWKHSKLNVLVVLKSKTDDRDIKEAQKLGLCLMDWTRAKCVLPFMFLEGTTAKCTKNAEGIINPLAITNVISRTQLNVYLNAAKLNNSVDPETMTKIFNSGCTTIKELDKVAKDFIKSEKNLNGDKVKEAIDKMKVRQAKTNTSDNHTETRVIAGIDGLENNQAIKKDDAKLFRSMDVKYAERELCLDFIKAFISQSKGKKPLNVQLKTFKAWVEINTLND